MDLDAERFASMSEEPVDPHRRIVDAHHHLPGVASRAHVLDLAGVTGHHVTDSVYIERSVHYRTDGPVSLRPVGETEAVAQAAQEPGRPAITAIVAHADLALGDEVDEVLAAHEAVSGGLLRGIRDRAIFDPALKQAAERGRPHLADAGFRRGVTRLAKSGYALDVWVYYTQLSDLLDLALATEDATVVVNHMGGPFDMGGFRCGPAGRAAWRESMTLLAGCPNVFIKLGGIGMDAHFAPDPDAPGPPPSSDDVAARWRADIRWCIETFSPARCMFESNYPVDGASLGFTVVWNAFQKIAADYSDAEQEDLFSATAARAYRLELGSDAAGDSSA